MDTLYIPVYKGKCLPVRPMYREPVIGAILNFTNYDLKNELPAEKFKVIGKPKLTTPMTYSYNGGDFGWSNNYEVYEFEVE